MQLVDAIASVEHLADNAVICARKPFAFGSDAVIAYFTDDLRIPEKVSSLGYTYFLGKAELAELLDMASRKAMSHQALVEFICHYATADAYPAWFYDLPDK